MDTEIGRHVIELSSMLAYHAYEANACEAQNDKLGFERGIAAQKMTKCLDREVQKRLSNISRGLPISAPLHRKTRPSGSRVSSPMILGYARFSVTMS